ncbi:GNAT family N-acetyltransferase [Haladaptatus sp. DJG-WS-42]|uniref:GNAT family N-acetyltransferase n=1 Tax=Haladaptatus sp. DJG-WS-42 TaxID=3120516 RepID=UPI0030D171FB
MSVNGDVHTFLEDTGEYTIRWYEPRDRAAFIDLYQLAFASRGEEWFTWKYEQNPYAERVPIIVAEKDGEIGAVRPFIPLSLRVADTAVPVIQLADLVVHPDHRRQGLMTTLSRWLKTTCWDDYASTFTYATQAARDGVLKMQNERWTDHDLGTFVKYERLNNVAAFVGNDHSLSVRLGATLATPAYRLKHRLGDRLVSTDPRIRVVRHESVPVSLLASLYETGVPETAHVLRDEAFYNWRFAEPGREFVTYVAMRDALPVAAIVVGTDHITGSPSTAQLVEVLPLTGGDALDPVFSALLSHITRDYAAVDHLCATGGALSKAVFSAHGFTATDSFPLSKLVAPAYLLVCPLGGSADSSAVTEGLTRESGWNTTYCDRLLG